jgi:acetyltransferase
MAALRPTMAAQLAETPALGLRNWRGRLVAEARYMRTLADEAEVAILITDKYQGRGLGLALLAVLYACAADEGITCLTANVLNSNEAIIGLLEKLTPVQTVGFEDGARKLRLPLEPAAVAA